ncbi:hypothetical protein [Paenibacillus sp. DMB5]|uniref:hypothetical protein n=1 Tax=Paenibacillus sp. DMB5 TaxID=1780103 RepID=UPI000A904C02|nr:hypothetical protein [Paenibacillus sp. DMB5]
MTKLWNMLGDPPAEYRSVPFWSWNDRLEKEELERQIEEMHRAGAEASSCMPAAG